LNGAARLFGRSRRIVVDEDFSLGIANSEYETKRVSDREKYKYCSEFHLTLPNKTQ
jgi:hypothetical protein